LLVLSELTDHLESEMGLGWLNVTLALPLAVIAVAAVAVGGDMLLAAVERRRGYRPGRALTRPLLTAVGLAATIEIALHHLRQAPRLDASLGLAGGTLLLIAAGLYRRALVFLKADSASPTSEPPPPTGNPTTQRSRHTHPGCP
jgi:hypothetical protein